MSTLSKLALFAFATTPSFASIYSLTNTFATVYYDITGQYCNGAGDNGPGTVPSGGYPWCEPTSGAHNLSALGTNSIVAIASNVVKPDPASYCGKQVQILDPSGNEFTVDDGPFYIWDTCDDCSTNPHIYISGRSAPPFPLTLAAKAFSGLAGGDCKAGKFPGITFNVLDNNIKENTREPDPSVVPASMGGSSGSAGRSSTSLGAVVPPQSSPAAESVTSSIDGQYVPSSSAQVVASVAPSPGFVAAVGTRQKRRRKRSD